MESQATPEFVMSPMRVQTMPALTYFYVTNTPTPFNDLDNDFDAMLDRLYAAKAQANLGGAGPDIVRYYKVDAGESDLYLMEIGIPVAPETRPAGAAQIKTLPPCHCAGLLLWGSLVHIRTAYDSLKQAIEKAGLEQTGESQEWTYYFESPDSPRNLMGIYLGIK